MPSLLRYLGLRLRPLLRPDWEQEQRTLTRIQSRVDQLGSLEELVSRQGAELRRVLERLDALAGHDLVHLHKTVTDLKRSVGMHAQATAHALKRLEFFDEQDIAEQAVRRVVDRALRTGRPVVAGPWTGEIGFELLYWIPFLRRLKARLRHVPVHVVSRGGVAGWYDGIADGYRDIFTLVTPDEFRRETSLETRKQRNVGPFDRRLLTEASRAMGLRRPVLLHPSLMYRLLYPYWKDQLPVRRLSEYLEPRLLSAQADPGVALALPERYVAVRFYFSASFPETPANRAFVHELLERVSARLPVVMMNTPFAVDDHVDTAPPGSVQSIAHLLTPENNLAVQTAVVSRAQAFVGTYGGYSYLAPLCGVPSVTFYSEAAFFTQHLEFARRTFAGVGAAPFVVLHERERALIDSVAAAAASHAPR